MKKRILLAIAALGVFGIGLARAQFPADRGAVPAAAALAVEGLEPANAGFADELKTYTWTGYAEVRIKKTGRVLVLRDSGTVLAPNFTLGSHLSYNAFRYGIVERSRQSLFDEVLKCTVNVNGPLP
jgi:hypothetical protein